MKPVDMMIVGSDVRGDCFRACVASLLEMPTQSVPHFFDYEEPLADDGWRLLQNWLRPMGLAALEIGTPDARLRQMYALHGFNPYMIVMGPARWNYEALHACVGLDFEVVHDPHPSRSGLARVDTAVMLVHTGHEARVLSPEKDCSLSHERSRRSLL